MMLETFSEEWWMIFDLALMIMKIITNQLKQKMCLMITIYNLRVEMIKTKNIHLKNAVSKFAYILVNKLMN